MRASLICAEKCYRLACDTEEHLALKEAQETAILMTSQLDAEPGGLVDSVRSLLLQVASVAMRVLVKCVALLSSPGADLTVNVLD